MIKQLQLRGISRSPSDRATPDGGCAESLNIHLEEGESAPTLPAEDLADKLQWEYPGGRYIYIHKGTNFENYIYTASGKIKYANKNDEQENLLTLEQGELIKDITSVGNTLIVASSKSMRYFLWKNTAYSYLGDKIPEPKAGFEDFSAYIYPIGGGASPVESITAHTSITHDQFVYVKNTDYITRKAADNREVEEIIWDSINEYVSTYRTNHGRVIEYFPRMARCAVKLYDGTYIYCSAPTLLGRKWVDPSSSLDTISLSAETIYVDTILKSFYRSSFFVWEWDNIMDWADIVESIDVFVSPKITPFRRDIMITTINDWPFPGTGWFGINYDVDDKDHETSCIEARNFYKIHSFSIRAVLDEIYNQPSSPTFFEASLFDKNNVALVLDDEKLVQNIELSVADSYSQYRVFDNITNYNGRLLASGGKTALPNNPNIWILNDGNDGQTAEKLIFILDISGNEKTVICDCFNLNSIMGWLSFQSAYCTKVYAEIDDSGTKKMYEHAMLEHENVPGLSYAFWGFGNTIEDEWDLSTKTIDDFTDDRVYEERNKLFLSDSFDPFYIPIHGIVTFDADIYGMAMASTPLSEGQFGQFPIYVFTDSGIKMLSINQDGSIGNISHLSRHVAINKNILSIEQAVIFISDKGVMMLQGSQVTNLSPDMTGRHYTLETDVASILSVDTSWSGLVPAMSDNTPFMAFMRDAKIAYDYKGGRLIFFNDAKAYQYVYMFGTASWHKLLGPVGEYTVLNSYPDCIVAKDTVGDTRYVFTITFLENDSDAIDTFYNAVADYAVEPVADQHFEEEIDRLVQLGEPITAWTNIEDDAISMKAAFDSLTDTGGVSDITYTMDVVTDHTTNLLDYSTVLDDAAVLSDEADPVKGIIITRPFDLGEPDIRKAIKSIRIRGKYDRGNVKYILCGSMDGIHWKRLTSFRGGSCNLYRLVILANLSPTERITWVDVDYETRFDDKLR